MDPANVKRTRLVRWFDKIFILIAGASEETLRLCPERDLEAVRAVSAIMIGTFVFQTIIYSIAAHRLFAAPGQIRPELILFSIFLGAYTLLIDSYVVMRSGWNWSGIQELRRGGLDVSGGVGARVKAGVFLAVRIILSVCIAQLTAIFLSLLIFETDIATRFQRAYIQNNANLIATATARVDADITRATDALNAENARVTALASQLNALRQNQIDPSASRHEMQQAQQELAQLLSEKTKADEAVRSAENFASNELAGIRGTQANSGIAGDGPRRRAAMEAVSDAKDDVRQIAIALDAVRNRIDALHKESVSSEEASRQQSQSELPRFEAALATEDSKFHALQDQLAGLTKRRNDAIREAVEAALNQSPADSGFLAQIGALEHIAQADPKIAAVIILIDLTSFGFELAAVVAKVFSFVPTQYAALIASEAYLHVVRLVDEMMAELNRGIGQGATEAELDPPAKPPGETPRELNMKPVEDLFTHVDEPLSPPPKRPRGRPRKSRPGENGRDLVTAHTDWSLPNT
jgi:hypothetical protein